MFHKIQNMNYNWFTVYPIFLSKGQCHIMKTHPFPMIEFFGDVNQVQPCFFFLQWAKITLQWSSVTYFLWSVDSSRHMSNAPCNLSAVECVKLIIWLHAVEERRSKIKMDQAAFDLDPDCFSRWWFLWQFHLSRNGNWWD